MNKIIKLSVKDIKELLKESNLLEFNREISDLHTLKMINSIQDCGILRLPVIGDISAFDKRKMVIIDGQHLCSAISKIPKEIGVNEVSVILKVYTEKRQVIEDISKLNNTQKSWNDENYLDAWFKFGKGNEFFSNYSYLYNLYNHVFDGLPCGFLVDLYARDKDAFKEGKLEFRNVEFSDKLAQLCYKLKDEYGKSSFTLHGLRIWAFNRLSEKKDVDWVKLESRLLHAVRMEEDKRCQKREDFAEFVQSVYTKL